MYRGFLALHTTFDGMVSCRITRRFPVKLQESWSRLQPL